MIFLCNNLVILKLLCFTGLKYKFFRFSGFPMHVELFTFIVIAGCLSPQCGTIQVSAMCTVYLSPHFPRFVFRVFRYEAFYLVFRRSSMTKMHFYSLSSVLDALHSSDIETSAGTCGKCHNPRRPGCWMCHVARHITFTHSSARNALVTRPRRAFVAPWVLHNSKH